MVGALRAVNNAVLGAVFVAGAVCVGTPAANAACQEGTITPAANGTYSQCTGGQWVHVNHPMCADFPQSEYCTTATASASPSSSAPASAAPSSAPPPVAVLPGAGVGAGAEATNVPDLGCTWVNGYTKSNGTHVSGHYKC